MNSFTFSFGFITCTISMVLLLNLLGSNGLILCSTYFGFSPKFSFSNCWKRLSILFSFHLSVFLTNCSRILSNFWLSFFNISFKFCCSTFIFSISFLQNLSSLTSCSFIYSLSYFELN